MDQKMQTVRNRPAPRGSRGGKRKSMTTVGIAAPPAKKRLIYSNLFPSGQQTGSGLGRQRRVVIEDEIVATIAGSVDFATSIFNLQPGLESSFPWLVSQADQYQRWKVRRFTAYYKPQVSAIAPQGQTGQVVLNHYANPTATRPTTSNEVLDIWPHKEGMAYETIVLDVPANTITPSTKLIRYPQLPGGADLSNYDGGFIAVSTYGNHDTSDIGKLHFRYEIELLEPFLNAITGPQQITPPYGTFQIATVTAFPLVSGIPSEVVWNYVSMNRTAASAIGTNLQMPPGNWSLTVCCDIAASTGATFLLNGRFDITVGGISVFGGNNGTTPACVFAVTSTVATTLTKTVVVYIPGFGSPGLVNVIVDAATDAGIPACNVSVVGTILA